MTASYRDTQTVLNADSLKQYDVAFFYTADHGSGTAGGSDLTTAQENALLDWVDSGHVIVAFHGSTNTYLNNPRWVNLLGAAFLDHGPVDNAGTVTFVQPQHPALANANPLPTSAANTGGSPYWDEGRRHQNFVSDTIVIARTQSGGVLPWIWVRPQGKGWVYYNSSGHDGQTWKMPQWKGQVIEALKWGAGIHATGLRGRSALAPLLEIREDRLFFPAASVHSLRIDDMRGRTVLSDENSSTPEYDLSVLPSGAYALEIRVPSQKERRGIYVRGR